MEGEVTGDRNYNLVLTCNEDGQRSRVTDIFVSPETKTLEVTFRYDKGKDRMID